MRASFRLGRISGIPIGVHWSILFIFGLITWGLADVVLPQRQPGHPTAVYWGAALVTAVLFYLCLLAHELSHALVARRAGLEVRGITLWLFGGVAELGGDARSPEVELRVGAVGPIVSLVLAGVFAGVAALGAWWSAPALLVAMAWWLGTINLTLGLFNLVPAYPLDGGRVLRSLLWRRRGDQEWATLSAARTGEVFALGLITFGLLDLASGGQRGGLWLTGLGWFLHSAARSERQAVVVSDAQVVGILSTDDIAHALESALQERRPTRQGRRPRGNGDRARHVVTNG